MDLQGKRVTVMGLGTFGGGVGAVRFLSSRGANVTVTDLRPAEELQTPLAEIADCPSTTLHLGGHQADDFRTADLLVVSPAVPKTSEYLQIAAAAGVPVTSEMNLFWEHNRGRTVCITGTNGKSTTAALTHALLAAGGKHRCWLGGNIGKSLLPVVDDIGPEDWVVLELSSFQLEDLAPLKPQPDVAIVTNFTPNHLDRHETIDAYRHAKQNILRWQSPEQIAILNQDDADVAGWETAAQKFWFGRDDEGRRGAFGIGFEGFKRRTLFRNAMREQVLPLGKWFSLPGVHNYNNALAATCAALLLGAETADIQAGLSQFKGLPHRLELVAESAGRKFYNDSKATTPEAALLAVGSFTTPVILLAGGYDKGADLTDLARAIALRQVKSVALFGQTAGKLEELITYFDSQHDIARQTHATFDAAFAWGVGQSASGDVVLLSPGCASYDEFPNYEARGDTFRGLAQTWKPGNASSQKQLAPSGINVMASARSEFLADFPLVITLPVQWGDQDAFGHVNNTVFFRWFESARIEYADLVGLSAIEGTHDIGPILAAVKCNYRRQVKRPDTVQIGAKVSRLGRSSMTMEHKVFSTSLGCIVADGDSTIVVFDYNANKPIAIPDALRAAIERMEGTSLARPEKT